MSNVRDATRRVPNAVFGADRDHRTPPAPCLQFTINYTPMYGETGRSKKRYILNAFKRPGATRTDDGSQLPTPILSITSVVAHWIRASAANKKVSGPIPTVVVILTTLRRHRMGSRHLRITQKITPAHRQHHAQLHEQLATKRIMNKDKQFHFCIYVEDEVKKRTSYARTDVRRAPSVSGALSGPTATVATATASPTFTGARRQTAVAAAAAGGRRCSRARPQGRREANHSAEFLLRDRRHAHTSPGADRARNKNSRIYFTRAQHYLAALGSDYLMPRV
ncbi:hypothetical protein EVAR_18967_1 [Eumeta japonica]|uniref:Uncharacterized protein n=1 Tax=Eumeta variegata TaxID=151549 RepID=A0A4C1WVX9_EUMVA|nr:hypothetical protein EVAR_18967_1 [Eumeta japonica]